MTFVGPSSDLRYLIGIDAHLSERLNLLILPAKGRPQFVVPVLEAPLARSASELVDIHEWEETQSPSELVGKLAGDLDGQTVAVSDQLWSGFLLKLQRPDSRRVVDFRAGSAQAVAGD